MDDRTAAVLEDIVRRESRSLMQYVGESFPWTPAGEQPKLAQLQAMIDEERRATAELARFFTRRRHAAPYLGQYPSEFTNVNFINTDRVDVDPRFNGPKLVDAFGDNGTRFVPIPIRTNRVFTNQDFSDAGEPRGDVLLVPDRIPANAPNLDIVNWQIEVRRQ